jgi:transmembrane sensor
VELNRGTVVHHAFTPTERRVELVTGEAFFSVTKDAARPFVVHAGGIDVRAVGTAFSVRLDSGAVEVLVTEGRVGVRHEKDGPSHGGAADGATTYVGAGEKATVARAAGTPPEVSVATSIQISRHLGWQAQWLDFSSAPLAVAVAEFNHRNRVQFEIADADLAALPIIALIRSDNVEGFAQFLAAAPGVQVERRSDELIIVHRRR